MASILTLCVALLSAVAIQASTVDTIPEYKSFLQYPPYNVPCELSWGGYFDNSLFSQLNSIALQNNIRLSDVYQAYALTDMNIPNLPDINKIAITNGWSSELYKEMVRRGLPNLPLLRSCYPYTSNPLNPTYPQHPDYHTLPAPVSTLSKRSPLLPPVADTSLPVDYNPAIPTNYDPTNSVNYIPTSTYNPTSSIDYQLALKNLYYGMEKRIPPLSYSTILNIRDLVYSNTSDLYKENADELIYQLLTSMKFDLAAATKNYSNRPIYY